jgi:hypothetical protein
VQNLGYLRKGNLCDLQKWLAEKTYMEMPNQGTQGTNNSSSRSSYGPSCRPLLGTSSIGDPFGGLLSLGKRIGIFPH